MSDADVTAILREVSTGDKRAYNALAETVHRELHKMAAGLMRTERPGHTLQPTALVNEAFIKLIAGEPSWESRAHFFGAAAHAMRRILVDYARRHRARKRGGGALQVTFSDLQVGVDDPGLEPLMLDEALTTLEGIDARLAKVVELRYFGGCSLEETARILDVSKATVKRDWTYARAWLYERMSDG